jgi:2-(1,2-epoxy-1,2-dihydrophenyl)acetyl-CoA isomerase
VSRNVPAVEFETIRYTVEDGLARLTLDRPDAGNAVDLDLARDLMYATTAASEDRSVRAVLLTGSGRNFCVGGDLKAFSSHTGDLGLHLKEVTTYLHAAVSRLVRLEVPVVAAVQGSAAGAGMSLACASDLLLMGASARLVLAYTRIGLSPDGSATWSLPRLVGLRRSLDLALTNRPLSADEAVLWGLASRVVADEDLAGEAEAFALELAAGATSALGDAKRLLRESLANPLETQMELETIALAANANRDGPEGIAAFLEKRRPQFGG